MAEYCDITVQKSDQIAGSESAQLHAYMVQSPSQGRKWTHLGNRKSLDKDSTELSETTALSEARDKAGFALVEINRIVEHRSSQTSERLGIASETASGVDLGTVDKDGFCNGLHFLL
eukprot:Em0002g1529a